MEKKNRWWHSSDLPPMPIRPCPGCPSDLCSLDSYHAPSCPFCFFPSGGSSVPPHKGLCICCSPCPEHPSLSSSTSQHLLTLLPISAQESCPQKTLFWPPWVGENLPQALTAPGIFPLDLSPLKYHSCLCHHLKYHLYPHIPLGGQGFYLCLLTIGFPELDKVSGMW